MVRADRSYEKGIASRVPLDFSLSRRLCSPNLAQVGCAASRLPLSAPRLLAGGAEPCSCLCPVAGRDKRLLWVQEGFSV